MDKPAMSPWAPPFDLTQRQYMLLMAIMHAVESRKDFNERAESVARVIKGYDEDGERIIAYSQKALQDVIAAFPRPVVMPVSQGPVPEFSRISVPQKNPMIG